MSLLKCRKQLLCTIVWLAIVYCFGTSNLHSQAAGGRSEAVVSFPTEDGKTIWGTLHLPKAGGSRVPGIVMFAEAGWIVRTTLEAPGREMAEKYGMAVLTADHRGNGRSLNGKQFYTYSPEEKDGLQLDYRGAVKFLSSQKMVDPLRIGVLAVGIGGNYAVLEAAHDPAIQALVLVSTTLGETGREVLRSRPDLPIYCMAGPDNKEDFRVMADIFSLSAHKDSRFVQTHSGHGTGMFSRTVGSWVDVEKWFVANVKAVGIESEITLKTSDGWKLHGHLRVPDDLAAGVRVSAVAFSHGANHDQDTFMDFTKTLAKAGIASIIYDRRGRNSDPNEPRPQFAGGGLGDDSLDLKAAIDYLAAQKEVDAGRIGVVGATAGNQPVFKAAIDDMRIKTIVALTLENISGTVTQAVTTRDIPIFYIASTEDLNTTREPPEHPYLADNSRDAYRISKNRWSQFLLYDDAGRGSEMVKEKPEIEGMMVRWFLDKLGAAAKAGK